MKKIRILAVAACLCLFSSTFLALGEGEENNTQTEQNNTISTDGEVVLELKSYESQEARLQEMEKITDSNGMALYFDQKTCDVALVNESTGEAFFSTPYNLLDDKKATDDYKKRLASQIHLQYMNNQGTMGDMYSFKDCVSLGQFATEKIDGGIKIDMVFGREQQRLLLPTALPAESFETIILASLEEQGGRTSKRVKAFYTKYDKSVMPETQYDEVVKKYPAVADGPIYVLKTTTATEKKELEKYIAQTPYTYEQMEADLEKVGGTEQESEIPFFKFTIEYLLDKGDLVVRLPAASIEYDNTKFRLVNVALLEFFGCSEMTEDGYLFLPDGSGTIISFNKEGKKSGNELTIPVYGRDRALTYTSADAVKNDARMPVFGLAKGSSGFLGIIEKGVSQGSLVASSGGLSSNYASISASFTYKDRDSFSFVDVATQRSWQLTEKADYTGDYQIRYKLLSEKDANYSGMARVYRQYLIDNQIIKESIDVKDSLPYYMGLYGTVKHQETFLIFPVMQNIPLTTFADAQTISDDTMSRGIQNINIRYLGWANGGIEHTAFNKCSVEGVLGGTSGLKKLNAYAKEKDIGLFMDADIVYVSRTGLFDGFDPNSQAIRTLDKKYGGYNEPDLSSSGLLDRQKFQYGLKPSVMLNFFQSFEKSYNKLGLNNLSLGTIGSYLNSDKDEKKGINRAGAMDYYTQILEKAASSYNLMTTGGNSYTLPYVQHIVAMEGDSSGYADAEYSVPFMQMVLHSSVQYTGLAVNLSGDPETELLKAVENGAGLYFEFVYQNNYKLKNTTQRDLFSVDYTTWAPKAAEYYERANKVIGDLVGVAMVEQTYVAPEVSVVTYANGAKVAVNYSDKEIEVDGLTVGARDFIRVK